MQCTHRSIHSIIVAVVVLSAFFIGSAWSTDAVTAEEIRLVQQRLTDLGHNPGPIDGIMGPKTRAAIRAYEKKEGLPVNGNISSQLLKRLADNVSEKANTSSPRASPILSKHDCLNTNASSEEYIAFSLNIAHQIITEIGAQQDYRVNCPKVFYLGGINHIYGLVYDRETTDVILVGQHDPARQSLTLDDFVVALRARFIHDVWPAVSIDPTDETDQTGMQMVRFEGGIEGTQFGADLLDADYRLKKIGFGLLSSGIQSFKPEWDYIIEELKKTPLKNFEIENRYWFYPILPSISVRENVVAIRGLKIGVFTEVLFAKIENEIIENLSKFHYVPADKFAKSFSENFETLSQIHPSFSRVQGLEELVALTRAIEEMNDQPDLDFWLKAYQVIPVYTPLQLEVLTRSNGEVFLSGGVQLTAIALRLRAGDVSALEDAVLISRPSTDSLSWSFLVHEWLIPLPSEALTAEDVMPLFALAFYFRDLKRYDEALLTLDRIKNIAPILETEVNIQKASLYLQDQGVAQDYKEAAKWFQLAAAQGDADAQYSLGVLYFQGQGVAEDYKEAAKWFRLAAAQGHAVAQNNLGVLYAKGQGVAQDYKEAAKWYQLAAAQGDADAQYHLGVLYAEGQGVAQDYKEAAKWYQLAAAQGLADAQNNLGVLYDKGQGVAQDYKEAAKWYQLAAAQGLADAQNNLGVLYFQGQGVAEDYKEAAKWFQLAAAQGDADAQYNLGVLYAKGQGVAQDYKEAAKWYQLAAAQGLADAQNNLGVLYDKGQGVAQDYKEAAKWYQLAAAQGHAVAQYNLGVLYDKGQGVAQDYKEAAKWFQLAAAQGHADAQYNLGVLYDKGQGVAQDYKEAAKWYQLAVAQGDADAQNNLGVLYFQGQGVAEDYKEAAKWFQLAAAQGHADAQNNLGVLYAEGQGVAQDYKEAAKWFQLAAAQGHADAQNNLGVLYDKGQGVAQDYTVAGVLRAAHQANLKKYDGALENGVSCKIIDQGYVVEKNYDSLAKGNYTGVLVRCNNLFGKNTVTISSKNVSIKEEIDSPLRLNSLDYVYPSRMTAEFRVRGRVSVRNPWRMHLNNKDIFGSWMNRAVIKISEGGALEFSMSEPDQYFDVLLVFENIREVTVLDIPGVSFEN